jgi:hypothetical protein
MADFGGVFAEKPNDLGYLPLGTGFFQWLIGVL